MADRVQLKHLRCFAAVAESGSFTTAAARLCLTPSALTATIQQFEHVIGQRLFDRSTRRVAMTADAERFLPEAQRLIKNFDSAVRDLTALSRGESGHIRIAAAASVIHHFLAAAIEDFRLDCSQVTIALRDAAAQQVERLVVEGEVDFGIESRHQGFEGLEYVPLLCDRYGVVCRSDAPLARSPQPLVWSALPSEGYVAFSADTGIGQFLRRNMIDWKPLRESHDEVTSTTSLFAMLRRGTRYSVVPAMAMRRQEFPELTFRELGGPALSRELCLITRRLRALSPGAERLMRVVAVHLRDAQLPQGVEVLAAPNDRLAQAATGVFDARQAAPGAAR
jgi:DNA-binding transcriptional LysR family regulator